MSEIKKTERNNRPRRCNKLYRVMYQAFLLIRYYADLLIDKIFGFFYNFQKIRIAQSNDPILLLSACSLAQKIRKREFKVEQVIRAYIKRIIDVNNLLNAVVDDRFESAVEEAKKIDKSIEIGEITDIDFREKPFLGVPFTSKDTTSAENMSNSFGLISRKNKKSKFDAEIIANLKKSGAILLGVTNIPQLNMWQETSNPLYGTTNNPYNITRNVGGSSGGEASIVAACGSPFGIGTDIGGSLRIPAFMCGLFGHKPTCNLISTNGLTFRTGKEGDTMVVAGPITRYSEDLIPILKVLLKENVNKLNLDKSINIKDIKVYYLKDPKDPFVSPFRPEMTKAFLRVVNYFEEILPQKPEQVYFESVRFGGKLWRYWISQEPEANFKRDLANREGVVNSMGEIMKYVLRKSEYTAAVIFMLINDLLPKENANWAEETTKQLKNYLIDKLGDNGVLLYPSAPFPASYHNTALLRPWNFNLFAIWNALKFPVTQVPLGLSQEGLPIGIQVVSAPFHDNLCIAVAKELEKQFGGYVPPFKVNKY